MAIFRFLRRRASPAPAEPPPCPAQPVAVIGDIHGRADLLKTLLGTLAQRSDAAELRLVIVGDMIDRGADSAAVLHHLHAMTQQPHPFAEVHCLMGNHERMLLDFLDSPDTRTLRWLSHGGEATLMSFGLTGLYSRNTQENADPTTVLQQRRDALAQALGAELETWLRNLPLLWREQQLVVTHAGADPRKPIAAQTESELLWGQGMTSPRPRKHGLWIAHGHVIVPAPQVHAGRINVDSGAWKTGRLSAAILSQAGLQFLQTEAP